MEDEPIHPTYGTLDQLLANIGNDVKKGYLLRIGQHGALVWFAERYSQLTTEAEDANRRSNT